MKVDDGTPGFVAGVEDSWVFVLGAKSISVLIDLDDTRLERKAPDWIQEFGWKL